MFQDDFTDIAATMTRERAGGPRGFRGRLLFAQSARKTSLNRPGLLDASELVPGGSTQRAVVTQIPRGAGRIDLDDLALK
jgi:hypothetical protein